MGSGTREVGNGNAATRAPIASYRDIEAYQRSMHVLAPLHRLIRTLPPEERFELASQMRRAAKSVPANIAEGYALKRSAVHFRSRLDIALGSANEMVVHLEIGEVIGYFEHAETRALIDGYEIVAKQLDRLIESWQDFSKRAASG